MNKRLPIPVPDLCCAIGGTDISSKHLEGGSFSCPVDSQQTEALQTITHFLVTLKPYTTVQHYDTMTRLVLMSIF